MTPGVVNNFLGVGMMPKHALDVNGDINCTGTFMVNGQPIGGGGGGGGSQTPWTSDIDAANFKLLNTQSVGIMNGAYQMTQRLLANGRLQIVDAAGGIVFSVGRLNANGTAGVGIGDTTPSSFEIAYPFSVRTGADQYLTMSGNATAIVLSGYNASQSVSFPISIGGGLSVGGSLGVGINSPVHKLEVNGDVNISGQYMINGTPHLMLTQEQFEALTALASRVNTLEAQARSRK